MYQIVISKNPRSAKLAVSAVIFNCLKQYNNAYEAIGFEELGRNEKRETPNLENISEKVKNLSNPKMQLSIFDAHSQTFTEIRQMLTSIDINRLTPVETLMKLNEIKGMIN